MTDLMEAGDRADQGQLKFMAAASGFSLARRLRAGETVFTGWCAIPSPVVAELIAREGFVAVTLDQQHGLYDMAATAAAIAMCTPPAPRRSCAFRSAISRWRAACSISAPRA